MKDFTVLKAVDNGKYFEVNRSITEKVSRTDLDEQLKRLEHQREVLSDQLEAIELRIDLVRRALENGEAEGDTTIAGLKLTL